MRADLYGEMYNMEGYYWWHVAKRELVVALINKYKKAKGKLKLLDLGCGTGMMLESLQKVFDCWGIDSSRDAKNFCNKRGLKQVLVSNLNNKLPHQDKKFDVVLTLDVLEHLTNDNKLLIEVNRVLKNKGILIITVPAYQWLWSYWDKILGHKRRYSKHHLNNVIEKSGLVVREINYSNCVYLPVVAIVRLVKSMMAQKTHRLNRASSDFIPLPDWLNKTLLVVSRIERKISSKIGLPCGLTIYAVCEKVS